MRDIDYSFKAMANFNETLTWEPDDRRGSSRLVHWATVKVWHSSIPEKLMQVRDFSDTGAFLFCDWSKMPPLGTVIEVQVQGLAEAAPAVKAKLVRFTEQGAGVVFVEE